MVKTRTLEDIEGEHNIKFTAIIADCEWCLVQVLDDFPQLLDQIEHLSVEYDVSHISSSEKSQTHPRESGRPLVLVRRLRSGP